MTNNEIESRLRTLVSEEPRLAREIVALIREVDRGLGSAHDWLTKSNGYSEDPTRPSSVGREQMRSSASINPPSRWT